MVGEAHERLLQQAATRWARRITADGSIDADAQVTRIRFHAGVLARALDRVPASCRDVFPSPVQWQLLATETTAPGSLRSADGGWLHTPSTQLLHAVDRHPRCGSSIPVGTVLVQVRSGVDSDRRGSGRRSSEPGSSLSVHRSGHDASSDRVRGSVGRSQSAAALGRDYNARLRVVEPDIAPSVDTGRRDGRPCSHISTLSRTDPPRGVGIRSRIGRHRDAERLLGHRPTRGHHLRPEDPSLGLVQRRWSQDP